MSASNAMELAILDHIFGGPDFARPATLYISLHTADPGEAGNQGTSEASGTGYARVAVTNNVTNFPAASAGSKANGTAITFPTVGAGGWGTVTHFGIGTSASGAGTLLFSGALGAPKTIDAGDPVSFAIGALTIPAD